MLHIIEFAREKGIEEGKTLGLQEGKTLGEVEMARDMVMEVLIDRFGLIPAYLSQQMRPCTISMCSKDSFTRPLDVQA